MGAILPRESLSAPPYRNVDRLAPSPSRAPLTHRDSSPSGAFRRVSLRAFSDRQASFRDIGRPRFGRVDDFALRVDPPCSISRPRRASLKTVNTHDPGSLPQPYDVLHRDFAIAANDPTLWVRHGKNKPPRILGNGGTVAAAGGPDDMGSRLKAIAHHRGPGGLRPRVLPALATSGLRR